MLATGVTPTRATQRRAVKKIDFDTVLIALAYSTEVA